MKPDLNTKGTKDTKLVHVQNFVSFVPFVPFVLKNGLFDHIIGFTISNLRPSALMMRRNNPTPGSISPCSIFEI